MYENIFNYLPVDKTEDEIEFERQLWIEVENNIEYYDNLKKKSQIEYEKNDGDKLCIMTFIPF